MRVTLPKRPAHACRVEGCDQAPATLRASSFSLLFAGDARRRVLFIKPAPSYEEVREQRYWVSEPSLRFDQMVRNSTDGAVSPKAGLLSYTTSLVICPACPPGERLPVRLVRGCFDRLQRILARPWGIVVCVSRETMRHLLMRGAAPPSERALLGRTVRSRDWPFPLLYVPDPDVLWNVDYEEREWVRSRLLREAHRTMADALAPLKEVLT